MSSSIQEQRQVWDLPVRLFHWALAASVLAAFATNKLGISYFKYHVWCGYSVILLVSFRILWGLVGTRHARFWNFVRGPATTARYALGLVRGQSLHYAGHNPLGALMVLALLIALGTQAVLGLFGNDDILNLGPLAGYVTKERSLALTSLHRKLFYAIPAAVAIHVLAVLAHRWFQKENLVRAMITGRKPGDKVPEAEAISSSRTWLALLLVIILAVALAWVIGHAPAPDGDGSLL